MGPIGISAIIIGGTTIYSGLGISDKMKACLRNKLSELKMVIINNISMVSSDLFFKINAELLEIFICSTETEFAGLIVILVDDLLQLPPVKGKPVYATADGCASLERHLPLNLWRVFQFGELIEVMRLRDDTKFIDLLNKIRASYKKCVHIYLYM